MKTIDQENEQFIKLEIIRLGKPIRLHLARVGICEENISKKMNNSQNLTLGESIRLGKPIRLHLARVGICEENISSK